MVFASLLAIAAILTILYLKYKWKSTLLSDLPGFDEIFLIGNYNLIRKKNSSDIRSTLANFQNVLSGMALLNYKSGMFRFKMGPKNFVVLVAPDAANALLSHRSELDKGFAYDSAMAYLGSGLITAKGNGRWKLHRKLLGPTFHAKTLHELYLPSMDSNSRKLTNILLSKSDQEYADVTNLLDLCTFDAIMEAGIGINMNSQENADVKFQNMIKALTQTWVVRMLKPWLTIEFIFGLTDMGNKFWKNVDGTLDFVRNILESKKNSMDQSDNEKAFIDLLISEQRQNPDSFTDLEMIYELNTFIAAGYDTTSYSTSWALYMIGLYPDIQDKVHQELDAIFGDDADRPIVSEDLARMKYLECVIKETMRLYPSIPMIVRQLNQDMTIDCKRIPRGTSIVISIYGVHRHPDYYENPEVFNPDRSFPDKAYIPFSAGLRNCIGQKFAKLEVKVVLANILRRIKVKSLDHRDKVVYIPGVVARPADQLRLKIAPRHISSQRSDILK